MDNIIVVKDLFKSYGKEVKTEVLHGINLTFERAVFTAIIGPSGSGKTSLLNILSLLEGPTSGVLQIDGMDFSLGQINRYAFYRNETVGFVFQFHYLLPEFNMLENILMPYWIGQGKPSAKTVKKATDLMKEMGIYDIRNKYTNQISGGQQQRVSIARALIKDPKIIFADEPTGNLDRESGSTVLEVFTKMIKEKGTTLIMVTHDRDIALKSDRVIELVDGRICKSVNIKKKGKKAAAKLLEKRACGIDE